MMSSRSLPKPFIVRRLHSFLGVWLVLYLCEHLWVNAHAALFFEDHASGFIEAVNQIHALPYLKVVEVLFLGLPFLIHGVWGLLYAWTGKLNAHKTDGSQPALPMYPRNRAYSWQRITSWVLVIGIVAHVVHMRWIEYPNKVIREDEYFYVVKATNDRGLAETARILKATLEPLADHRIAVFAPTPGSAFFFIVRETFKSPWMVMLYSLLVIGAAYHAFNGLWTFMITWGITLTGRAQRVMRMITTVLMGIVIFLGLMAAWGTYWVTQFQG
jgi:succinate dehydrogenase / fumarate reductase, cytochrome b subunit